MVLGRIENGIYQDGLIKINHFYVSMCTPREVCECLFISKHSPKKIKITSVDIFSLYPYAK